MKGSPLHFPDTLSGDDHWSPSAESRPRWDPGLIIVLLCAALLTIAGSALHRTSATTETYFGTIQALVEHNSFALDRTHYSHTIDKVFVGGHFYTHKPLLLPVIGAVVYWPLSLAGLRLGDATQVSAEIVLTAVLIGGSFLLAIVALHWALGIVTLRPRDRLAITGTLAFSTLMLPFSIVVNGQEFAACWVAVGFACLVRATKERKNRVLTAMAGVAFGIATGVDHASLVFTAVFALSVLYRRRTITDALIFVAPTVLVMAAVLYVNWTISGSAKPLSMQHGLFSYPGSYWTTGAEALSGQRNSLPSAIRYGTLYLFGLNGFIWYNPVLLLAFSSIVREIASRGVWALEAAAVLCATIMIVAFYAFTTSNYGGNSYSIRWFLLFVPPCVFFLFLFLQRGSTQQNRIFLCLLAAGVMFALGGWIDPWTPPSRYPAIVRNVVPRLMCVLPFSVTTDPRILAYCQGSP
jgi:hypothetical protein